MYILRSTSENPDRTEGLYKLVWARKAPSIRQRNKPSYISKVVLEIELKYECVLITYNTLWIFQTADTSALNIFILHLQELEK